MFAALAERFEKTLSHRRDVDADPPHPAIDHRSVHSRMQRCLILDDLKGSDARARR